mgnify:CR=1 FL=1
MAEALKFQLLRLQAMQDAGKKIFQLPQRKIDFFPRGNPEGLPITYRSVYDVSLYDLLRAYARAIGLKRLFIRVPVLTPRLSSLWLGLVTPVYARVGRELVEGLKAPTVVEDDRALRMYPIQPMGMDEQIARALLNEDNEFAETRWSDAMSSLGQDDLAWGGARRGSRTIRFPKELNR